jgi:hypothetical protein
VRNHSSSDKDGNCVCDFDMELLKIKCILKHILLQQKEIGLIGGTNWNLFFLRELKR